MLFRRKEIAWEVVDSKSIQPVPMFYEDEDLEVVSIKETNVRRTYVLDVKRDARESNQLLRALMFAREQLQQEIKRNGYNVLLSESWNVTVLRKAKLHRIQVEYGGRPALALNKIPERHPPFMAILQTSH
ncbi:hypothetical protein JR316_0001222 [Psilocybe cubensis]|uniref:Uncharacterized protein n=2 Tax=Psilocybe cubensis TaxID=181762 RepID=A0A8H8CRW9_PSICU|nr:hypothetical protein JR316_0001222 [Psilocybe cubensis]KAH9487153.1 hypothetical protein JR316_0001222 [Psilocybe cubensis]